MTKDEAERIDKLTADIADWRVETKDAIIDAVTRHQASCLELHLTPMMQDLDWLVTNAKRREAEADYRRRQRKRYLTIFGVLVPVCAITAPLLVHWGII